MQFHGEPVLDSRTHLWGWVTYLERDDGRWEELQRIEPLYEKAEDVVSVGKQKLIELAELADKAR
jgi:hypothetical protein